MATRVLIVDDIIVSGRTIRKAIEKLKEFGASEIKTAALTAHVNSVKTNFLGLVTDAIIIFPWDKEVIDVNGCWKINPEYNNKI